MLLLFSFVKFHVLLIVVILHILNLETFIKN